MEAKPEMGMKMKIEINEEMPMAVEVKSTPTSPTDPFDPVNLVLSQNFVETGWS